MNFVEFVLLAYPVVLIEGFKASFEVLPVKTPKGTGAKNRRAFVKERLDLLDPNNLGVTALVKTELISEAIVGEWLAGFRGKNGTTPSKSVYGMAQSALVDLFKRHGATFPPRIYENIKDIQTGAKRTRAQEKVEGKVPMEEGKAAIPGHLYLEIVAELMRRPDDVFAWAFAVCSWVLMCRVSNVAELRTAHMSWNGDSLILAMVRHKADQEGERTDPKHCYANPFNPSACVVTAIGIFFAVYGPPTDVHSHVFEGNRQHDRFVEAIRRVLDACPNLKAKCDQLGITVEDIASHSFRKGARSFVQGGTTSGPSTPSILLRGGWALEGWCFPQYGSVL